MAAIGEQEDEDLARLASRIAMLASDPGEAANAGRAAGAMARRMGLSGGDLKEIFLAGLRAGGGGRQSVRGRDLTRENEALRESLEAAELAAKQAIRERDRLRRDLADLRTTMQSRRRNDIVTVGMMACLIGVAAIGGAWLLTATPSPASTTRELAARAAADPGERMAIVRVSGATVRAEPEPDAGILAQLPPGSRVAVRRLVWNALLQWVEVDLGGHAGYIETTDVEL